MGNVTISCPCGKKYSVPETTIGKKGKCKSCGAIFAAKPDEEIVEFFAEVEPTKLADKPTELISVSTPSQDTQEQEWPKFTPSHQSDEYKRLKRKSVDLENKYQKSFKEDLRRPVTPSPSHPPLPQIILMLLILGIVSIILGLFLPFISGPMNINFTYLGIAKDGKFIGAYFIPLFAITSLMLFLFRLYWVSFVFSLISAAWFGIDMIKINNGPLESLKDKDANSISKIVLATFNYTIGVPVIALGILLIIVCVIWGWRESGE